MTLGQETRRAYSTTLPSPHGHAHVFLFTQFKNVLHCFASPMVL